MSKTLYIKTLSPIHIGKGNQLEPFEYVLKDSIFYRLRTDAVFAKIAEAKSDFSNELSEWIEDTSSKVERERDNSRQSELRSKFTLLRFISEKLRDKKLYEEINKSLDTFSKYSLPCDSLSGKKTVQEILKTQTNELYIPGTSLKGSLRTVLLFHAIGRLEKKRIATIVTDSLRVVTEKQQRDRFFKKQNAAKEFASKIEQEIFYCGLQKNRDGRVDIIYSDEKFDLMKLISITDSNTKKTHEAGRIAKMDLYLINEIPQGQTLAVESIAEEQMFECRLSVDIPFILKAKELLMTNDSIFGKQQWIGFKDKFGRLFGITLEQIEKGRENEAEEKIIEHILSAIKNFSIKVIEREQSWATANKDNPSGKRMLQFYENIKIVTPLKLGYASGFPATTIFLALATDDAFKPLMKDVLEFFEIGKSKKNRERQIEINTFPISHRFETNNNSVSMFGWIAINTTNDFSSTIILENAAQTNAQTSQPIKPQPQGTVRAEIIDSTAKPPKVKILEGKYTGQTTQLPGIRVENLGIKNGDGIFVKIIEQNRKIQSCSFVQKIS